MSAYYNEFDPQKAAWLRELIKRNLIADGEVDERSIEDVLPADVAGFSQCHWFAGIGIWSYSLRHAGWPDDRPVWTASCPCQPFSTAGKGKGIADERHLWPAFYHIASIRKPDVIFGEQVASKDGLAWLDTVQSDMEAMAYAFGPVVIPAAGVGAPHIRHRIFFVADTQGERCGKAWERRGRPAKRFGDSGESRELVNSTVNGIGPFDWKSGPCDRSEIAAGRSGLSGSVVNAECERIRSGGLESPGTETSGVQGAKRQRQRVWPDAESDGTPGVVDDASQSRLQGHSGDGDHRNRPGRLGAIKTGPITATGPVNGFWRDAEWVYCRPEPRYPEGSYRAVRPGSFPLADGAPARVGSGSDYSVETDQGTAEARTLRLKGYGDGIVAQVAIEFIKAYKGIVDGV